MLRKLTIGNYFSILDDQVLDLSIAKNATDPDHRFAEPIAGGHERFPKVVAVFGANASGKTTVLRAIEFLQNFALYSADWPREDPIPILNFMSDEGRSRPTRLVVEFDGAFFEDQRRVKYLYEVEFDQELTSILREALFYFPRGYRRRLFIRQAEKIEAGDDFELRLNDPIRTKLRANASVISTLAKFEHPFSVAIFNNLRGIQTNVGLIGKRPPSIDRATRYYQEAPNCLEAFKSLIKKFDFGIDDLRFEKAEDGVRTFFNHSGLEGDILLSFESQGTRNIYQLFPGIWFALRTGNVVALDEFDNDIHPLILPEIIKIFQEPETNPFMAQLIVSCHNASILEHLVKEEIFFTEKSADGQTSVYGLSQVKGVRRDTNIYAKYLAGAFGGVPKLA